MNNLIFPSAEISNLSSEQLSAVTAPLEGKILLTGSAGCGKTTAGAFRLRYLAEQGIPGDSILILVPQRSIATVYYEQAQKLDFPSNTVPSILTFGGLAQRMITLFWPVIAKEAGFKFPSRPCKFLTLETAQYYLAKLVEPLLQQGYFDSLTIDPNRLYSQILDNLNKSAAVGFPPAEISSRLTQAWAGKPAQSIIYKQGQECALLFRDFCYQNNLLDFSLQLSVFVNHLWPSLVCKKYLQKNYQHLIYDNIEEDIPIAHDVMLDWLPSFKTVMVIQDSNGGFRTFLGADPSSSMRISENCSAQISFSSSFVKSPSLSSLESSLSESLIEHRLIKNQFTQSEPLPFSVHASRFYPDMMERVVSQIQELLGDDSIHPGDIAILTPFLSDALRFSFTERLSNARIPYTTYRPSRSLRDEPAVQAVLTLAKLAHPGWNLRPTSQSVRNALASSINDCDIIRAHLLTEMLYKPANDPAQPLHSFAQIRAEMQSRITFSIGEKFERLRTWLVENSIQENEVLDHWINRFFGEILSQEGFGFHTNFDSAAAVSRLLESCRKFRQALQPADDFLPSQFGAEYIRVLEQGILAAQSLTAWTEQSRSDAVFLSPAFSFLMANRPVKYQFWIDIGSQGWWSRLDQPLTQPFVLNRNWPAGKLWTDAEEFASNQITLSRVTTGLIRRCCSHIFMYTLGYNEQGLEEKGPLVMAVQTLLRQINLGKAVEHA